MNKGVRTEATHWHDGTKRGLEGFECLHSDRMVLEIATTIEKGGLVKAGRQSTNIFFNGPNRTLRLLVVLRHLSYADITNGADVARYGAAIESALSTFWLNLYKFLFVSMNTRP